MPVWLNWIKHLTSNREIQGSSPCTGYFKLVKFKIN